MKGPLDFFFSMGDKVTRGDPQRQQDFMYYMVWILFLAFVFMFLTNLYNLIMTPTANFAIWAAVGFAISGLQFFTLKSLYDSRKMRLSQPSGDKKTESVEEMLASFEEEKQ